MKRASSDFRRIIPTIASVGAIVVSVLSGLFLSYAFFDLRTVKGFQIEVERLIKISEASESKSKHSDISAENAFLVACIGGTSTYCDPYKIAKINAEHKSAAYKTYKCGSDLQDIASKFCPKGQVEKHLISSKPGGECGYTEIFMSCEF
jgi:hypothetical protein